MRWSAMRVCTVPANLDGAGSYRVLFPSRTLKRLGWDVRSAPCKLGVNGRGGILVEYVGLGDADVYVLQLPRFRKMAEVVPRLRADGKLVVVDSDDDTVNIPVWNPSRKRLAEGG